MFGKKRPQNPKKLHTSYARRVYHGTEFYFSEPDTKHSKPPVDFGHGFYTTPDREYAKRLMREARGLEDYIVIGYIFDDDAAKLDGLTILNFKLDDAWTDFLMWNRTGISDTEWPEYDIAIGPSADDGIDRVIAKYERKRRNGEIINPEEMIKELETNRTSHQILFHSDRSLGYLREFEHEREW